MSDSQVEPQFDRTTQALHQVLAKLFGDNGNEVDPSFAEVRRRCKDKFRVQDLISVPILQEVCSSDEAVANAIRSYPGFFVRNDVVKQHHEYMPQNAVLMRDLPKYSNSQIMELFQGLILEDGSSCPLPIPEKIRSENNNWLAVFSSVEDAQKALIAVRNATNPDGKNIRAVQRNETTRLTSANQNNQKRDGGVPMYPGNIGNLSPHHQFPPAMYGQTTYISGAPQMFYQQPSPQGFQPYYHFLQAPPQYPMPGYMPAVHYQMPQSPYAVPPPQYFDMSAAYGVPPQALQPNAYLNNNNSNLNNPNNKSRRNNGGQYPNNRPNQSRPRDPNQPRYSRSGDEGMVSPGVATEVAAAALDTNLSVPRSFSADAEEIGHQGFDSQVPIISVPTSENLVPEEVYAPLTSDETTSASLTDDVAGKRGGEEDATADKDSGNDKSSHNKKDGARRDGNNRSSKSNKDGDERQNRRNNGRDNKGKQDKDGAAKRERKPPVNLNLEKDFPTLQIGDASKVTSNGKVAFNYANALKKPQDDSPKPIIAAPVAKPSVPQTSSNSSNNGKKEARSSSKGSSPNLATAQSTSAEVQSQPVKKVETAPAVETVVVAEVKKAPATEKPVAEPVEMVSAAAESDQSVSGGRKTFIDAVRAKK